MAHGLLMGSSIPRVIHGIVLNQLSLTLNADILWTQNFEYYYQGRFVEFQKYQKGTKYQKLHFYLKFSQ